MKKPLRTSFQLMAAMLFPALAFGQTSDFSILLNSGKFLPQENTKTLNRDSETLRHSLYNGKHYVGLQFKTLPDQAQKEKLAAAGVTLHDYLPNLAYLASVPQHLTPAQLSEFGVRSVFRLSQSQKTIPAILKGELPEHAVKTKGYADVTLTTYETLKLADISEQLAQAKAEVLEETPEFRNVTVRVPVASLASLVELPFVQWVEPVEAPVAPENSKGRSLHRVNGLQDGARNLKGDGIKIGIWDGDEVSRHLDFSPSSRLLIREATGTQSDHGTHCAGTIIGRGLINPKAKGMAPNATLYSYNFSGTVTSEVSSALYSYGLNISSHSYGSTTATCGLTGSNVTYSTTSRNTDINLNNYNYHLHVHSAGNSQTACTDGWTTITGSGKSAKNNIVVANISTTEALSSSSSFGPVQDGRVKPEISALGTSVYSSYMPLNAYGTLSGTSMATPGVAGSLALIVQRYKQLYANALPISSLVKAVALNTAHDLGNPGPDYKFGYGRINTLAAVKAIEETRFLTNSISTGGIQTKTITVPTGAVKLKVMLTWNDPAAASNSSVALVNNLNLEVVNGTTTLPWILDKNNPANPATRGVDNISNIEQVTIDNPAAGTYTIRVKGTSVPSGTSQQYSLTWEVVNPFIEVTFPNGGESLSPATYEYITWDNAGVTGPQTLQYSIDGGTTWTNISTTVAATTTRYNWYVPSALNTANALIRVTDGILSDQSDAPFQTLRVPTGLKATADTITAGAVKLTWNATTNATHYDILSLSTTTGAWSTYASNIVGTTYTTPVLTTGSSRWFTLIAKNNTLGTVSDRAVAINHVVGSSARMAASSETGGRLATAKELGEIVLYPNPTQGKFSIRCENPTNDNLKITIFDALGKQVQLPATHLKTTQDGAEIDLSNHGKGIFLIYLHNANGQKIATEKVIVVL
ncbi:S8 family serine peptidase [Adhaeribacter soli]|uniref:S8 family serine peptidase n=1 Tax=Adhaeribacter soli TaxID=2607655 RepID=A0A5N1J3E2_9BACT|nr:S8 family serine peptidase [Adhaeribacter soli]KAA9340615.1 S8 family serine peptidase [Adhaeribacter soli]